MSEATWRVIDLDEILYNDILLFSTFEIPVSFWLASSVSDVGSDLLSNLTWFSLCKQMCMEQ